MLTVKQGNKRVVNPELTPKSIKDRTKESLFKTLVVECGFMPSHRKNVWTHTKDENFSVQLDSSKRLFLFEYRYTSDKVAYGVLTHKEFISSFLKSSRNFFQEVVTKPTE